VSGAIEGASEDLLLTAKDLRKRGEALLEKNINPDDADEIRTLMHDSATAIKDRDWPALASDQRHVVGSHLLPRGLSVRLICPACRKSNELVGDTNAACIRCDCDLSRLRAVQLAATQARHAATRALRLGDWSAALEHAERAWWLRHHVHAARLAALACGALGQTEALVTWRHRAHSLPPAPR
jgi:hypothetical protein